MRRGGYYGEHPALELINSERWYGRGASGSEDLLQDAMWLAGYLERWLLAGVPEPTRRDVAKLASLRAVLRRAHTAVSTNSRVEADDVAAIDEVLAAAVVRRRVDEKSDSYALSLEPITRDWRWVAAEIAASFVELLAEGESERMKLCENAECLCAFYDESKNRSRRWCYPEVCGNLYKVRQFRERNRRARRGSGAS